MKTVSVLDTGDPNVKFVNTWSLAMPIHWRFSGIRSAFRPISPMNARKAAA